MARRPLLPVGHHFVVGLLLLTASTGCVDAVSYLALDKVFTGNMTGNILFIGFSAVGAGKAPLLNNLLALAGFVIGSIVGGRIVGTRAKKGLPMTSRLILVGGAAILAILATYWLLVQTLPAPGVLVVTTLLAAVMGAQVSAVKPIGNSDVTTIVVTNTLANLARDSRLAGGSGKNWFPRLAAILAMAIGAAVGAAFEHTIGGAWALVAGAVIFIFGTVTLVSADRRAV